MTKFPYPKTEEKVREISRGRPSPENYKDLLYTFIQEYRQIKGLFPLEHIERMGIPCDVDMTNDVLTYLLEEDTTTKFLWFYTLEHQVSYYSGHQTFDDTDLNFITLKDIIQYPTEYIPQTSLNITAMAGALPR